MADQLVMEAIEPLIILIIGFLFGIIINPVKKHLKERDLYEEIFEKPKYKFRITHLISSYTDPIDFSTCIKEQNAHQRLFKFEVERVRTLTKEEDDMLSGKMSKKSDFGKKDFLELVGEFLTNERNESWKGLDDKLPNPKDKKSRDLVLTNVPIPGNFYAWNSMDRALLVISTVSIFSLFKKEKRPNLDDFVVRMLQRMTTFAIVPDLNPISTHTEVCSGCLFDFTVELKQVVDVVRIPFICQDCAESIKKSQGIKFANKLKKWNEEAPYFGSFKKTE